MKTWKAWVQIARCWYHIDEPRRHHKLTDTYRHQKRTNHATDGKCYHLLVSKDLDDESTDEAETEHRSALQAIVTSAAVLLSYKKTQHVIIDGRRWCLILKLPLHIYDPLPRRQPLYNPSSTIILRHHPYIPSMTPTYTPSVNPPPNTPSITPNLQISHQN